MKRTIYVLAIIAGHVLGVLILARVVRAGPDSLGAPGVTFMAALAYGLPFIGALIAYLRWPLRPAPRIASRIACYLSTALLLFFGHSLSLFTLQQTDIALTERYLTVMRARLAADARFQRVRLGRYSCDYVLFPYITVRGDVASEQDRKDLNGFLRSSRAPVFRSASMVSVAGHRPTLDEFMSRAREP